jgi:di/tricarboxylate transporter
MTVPAIILAAVIVAMIAGVALGRFRIDVAILGALLVLLLAGILDARRAFVGFASPAVITVAFLYVVATGLEETGAMIRIGNRLIGRATSALSVQARIAVPVAALSAFINNTPIVAVFLPVVGGISRRIGVAPSLLFMPLSFAVVLGGTCTLIGTSTNVVIEGLVTNANLAGLGMFGFAKLGVPVTVAGVAYLLLFGRKLLPKGEERSSEDVRKYMAVVKVSPGAPLAGKTVAEANLRNLPGLFLSRIERGDQVIVAVGPNEKLEGGDILGFVGNLDSVVDLHKIQGLEPAHEEIRPKYRHDLRLIEAVISPMSPLIGRTIKDAEIRTRYGAVIIAVHRHGHRVEGKLGSVVLQAGDTLLLEAPAAFADRHKASVDFHLVSMLEGSAIPRHDRAYVALAILVGLIALLALRVFPAEVSAMLAAAAMGVTRCCTAPQARAKVDWSVLIVIGAAFGLSDAMQSTGLAATASKLVLAIGQPLGAVGLLAAVYLITALLSAFIHRAAAVALVFPIALSVTTAAGYPFTPFAAIMAIAASCEFSTPIGYQTHLMVMGPGGYRWADYTRYGGPLTILCGVVAVGLAPLMFDLVSRP